MMAYNEYEQLLYRHLIQFCTIGTVYGIPKGRQELPPYLLRVKHTF